MPLSSGRLVEETGGQRSRAWNRYRSWHHSTQNRTKIMSEAKRYHGTVVLDPARVGRDGGRIADEVVTHLVGLVGSSVTVTLEIEAEIPAGAPDNVVRTVTENSRTLTFTANSGFETREHFQTIGLRGGPWRRSAGARS